MLGSIKKCGCFDYMIQSIKSIAMAKSRQNRQSQQDNKSIVRKKQVEGKQNIQKKGIQYEISRLQYIQSKSVLNSRRNNQKNKQKQVFNSENIQLQSQRKIIQEELNEIDEPISQSDLPTEKSQILINDIDLGVDKNQNNYLFNSQSQVNVWDLYQKIKLLDNQPLYQQYLVKKNQTNRKYIARVFKLKSFKPQKQSMQEITNQYELAKNYIKCITELNKINCRNMFKIIDYQLKPPTINIQANNKFDLGSACLIYQEFQNSLINVLNDREDQMDKLDRKKIIYQLCSFFCDLHQKNMVMLNFKIQNIKIDKFQNVKIIPSNIYRFSNSNSQLQEAQQDIVYLSPQQIQKILKKKRNSIKSKYFQNNVQSKFNNIDYFKALDLWRLGIIICKILTKKWIFQSQTYQLQLQQINNTLLHNQNQQKGLNQNIVQNQKESSSQTKSQNSKVQNRLLCTKLLGLSFHEIQIIQMLLKLNPLERASSKEIIQAEYFISILVDSCHYSFEKQSQQIHNQ